MCAMMMGEDERKREPSTSFFYDLQREYTWRTMRDQERDECISSGGGWIVPLDELNDCLQTSAKLDYLLLYR